MTPALKQEQQALQQEFHDVRAEHERLRNQQPFDRAAHHQHTQRLRALIEALHTFRMHADRANANKKSESETR